MESNSDILLTFSNNCRICMQIHQQMTSIESLKESNDYNLLLAYFNIEVIPDARYPNQICIVCLGQLNNTILLRQRCETTSNFLKNMLNESEFQFLPVETKLTEDENPIKSEQFGQDDFDQDNISTGTDEDNIKIEKPEQSVGENEENSNLSAKTKNQTHFKCQYCEKTFKSTYNRQRHELTHQKTTYKCDSCPKTFTNKDLLTRHIRIHMGQKPIVCTVCSQTFTRTYTLQRHIKKLHSDNPPPKVICKKCGLAVSSILSHNIYKHTEHKHQCQYCQKKFPFRSSLQTHIQHYHENTEESFKVLCTHCGKKFRRNSDLNYHNKVNHLGLLNYQCRYCEKRFKTSSCRANHEKVHFENQFKCTYCPKTFLRKMILMCHLRTHTGERPYSCNICSKTFRQTATLLNHTKLVHGSALTVKK